MDLRSLILYTKLPELSDLYDKAKMTSPVVETGYSLVGMSGVLAGSREIPVTHSDFWFVMTYFLSEDNAVFNRKLKATRASRGIKK